MRTIEKKRIMYTLCLELHTKKKDGESISVHLSTHHSINLS